MIKITYIILLYLVTIVCQVAFSQTDPNKRIFESFITSKDTLIDLNVNFVMQYTDEIILDNIIRLSPSEDYKLNYRTGIITLVPNLFSIYDLDTNREYNIRVYYDVFPFTFKDEYSNFEIITERDTLTGDTIVYASQRVGLFENVFEGTDLEKSGTLFRGFTVGSNRDLSLSSGFRLQMKGNLSKDIEITAALTDESTPIQPEGNTTRIQELDKVFIEVKSNNIISTIGDIELNFDRGEFFNFDRKIQGAKGEGKFGNTGLVFTGAVSRGKFATNNFNGIDGVQGPYRLLGADNEVNILVLSGTEKVYLDGIEMTRGQNADYIIDYGIGEITFMNTRPITSYSRITVDFEYADRRYSRTLLAGNNDIKLFDDKIYLGFNYVNEFDNRNSTIDFELSEEDKQILSQAGADRFKATKSGVSFAGVNPNTGLGAGLYVLVKDSVTSSGTVSFYRYSPGTDSSFYNIQFAFVGQGNGSYNRRSSLEYFFVGTNQGNYDTIIFIPIPSAYQVAGINFSYSPALDKSFYFDLESAYSFLDGNLYSESPIVNIGGVAFNGNVGYSESDVNILGVDFKTFSFKLGNRIVNKSFNSLDRLNSVEFNRDFNVVDTTKKTENLIDGIIKLNVNDAVKLDLNFAQLSRGTAFNSLRNIVALDLIGDSLGLPNALYKIEYINSSDDDSFIKGNWLKHFALVSWNKYLKEDRGMSPFLRFSLGFNSENRENSVTISGQDSLQFGSFAFKEYIPRIDLKNLFDFDIFAEFRYRNDDEASSGSLFDLSNTYEQRYGLIYRGIRWASISTDISIRDRKFTEHGKFLSNTDNNTVLVKSQLRFDPFDDALRTDVYYDVSSERTAKIERIFVQVNPGEGTYQYLGDIYGGGLNNENNFQLVNFGGDYVRLNVPTDELFPTIDLRTSFRVNFRPHRFFNLTGSDFVTDLFRNIRAESFFRIDEKSRDPNTSNIYFLNFSSFLNDSNTLQGVQLFQQDLNFFENNPAYSLRLRFVQQKGFNQFANSNERLTTIQRSARLRVGLTQDLVVQMDLLNKIDNNAAPRNLPRNRAITSDGISFDFTYKPIVEIESGFQFNFTKAKDSYPFIPIDANINQQIFRFIYSITGIGRFRAEIERSDVNLSAAFFNVPYELTSGKVDGKSYFWRAIFDYNISRNLQTTINYDGRVEGQRKVIHEGRAQFTAFF